MCAGVFVCVDAACLPACLPACLEHLSLLTFFFLRMSFGPRGAVHDHLEGA